MKALLRFLALAVATAAAAWLIPGISLTGSTIGDRIVTALLVAAVIALVNMVVKPLVSFVSGCLIMATFGLFLLVINALMLLLASWISGQAGLAFHVDGFWPALLGSIVISVVSWFINGVTGATRRPARRD